MEQKLSKKTRTESDLIGSREVPESALYGVQTLRGIENFRISKFHLNEYPLFIQALAITKMGAAVANRELDLLTEEQTDAILKACKEILEGKHHDQFPVDMIQGGAGTTTNMNANEVIANRALDAAISFSSTCLAKGTARQKQASESSPESHTGLKLPMASAREFCSPVLDRKSVV